MATKDKLTSSHPLIPSIEPPTIASEWPSATTSPVRGRKRRRRSALSQSPARSPSPSRGHDRDSASRHRGQRRSRLGQLAASAAGDSSDDNPAGPTLDVKSPKRLRRRSDLDPDHTFRGRARHRSRSGSHAIAESASEDNASESQDGNDYAAAAVADNSVRKKRSSPPSRNSRQLAEHSSDKSALRRQRSLPNQYNGFTATREAVITSDT